VEVIISSRLVALAPDEILLLTYLPCQVLEYSIRYSTEYRTRAVKSSICPALPETTV